MTKEQERCLADALDTRSKHNRQFAYVLLIVITFVLGIGGYNLSGLISSLSNNMDSIALDLKAMRHEMISISHNIQSMDRSIITVGTDIHSMSTTLEGMGKNVNHIDQNIQYMHKDMKEISKINPFLKVF